MKTTALFAAGLVASAAATSASSCPIETAGNPIRSAAMDYFIEQGKVRSNSFPVLTQDTLWKYGGAPGTPVTLCGQFNYGCGYDSWFVDLGPSFVPGGTLFANVNLYRNNPSGAFSGYSPTLSQPFLAVSSCGGGSFTCDAYATPTGGSDDGKLTVPNWQSRYAWIIVSGGDGTHCPGDYEDSSVFTYEFDVDYYFDGPVSPFPSCGTVTDASSFTITPSSYITTYNGAYEIYNYYDNLYPFPTVDTVPITYNGHTFSCGFKSFWFDLGVGFQPGGTLWASVKKYNYNTEKYYRALGNAVISIGKCAGGVAYQPLAYNNGQDVSAFCTLFPNAESCFGKTMGEVILNGWTERYVYVVVSGGEDGSCPTDADDEGGLDMAFYWDYYWDSPPSTPASTGTPSITASGTATPSNTASRTALATTTSSKTGTPSGTPSLTKGASPSATATPSRSPAVITDASVSADVSVSGMTGTAANDTSVAASLATAVACASGASVNGSSTAVTGYTDTTTGQSVAYNSSVTASGNCTTSSTTTGTRLLLEALQHNNGRKLGGGGGGATFHLQVRIPASSGGSLLGSAIADSLRSPDFGDGLGRSLVEHGFYDRVAQADPEIDLSSLQPSVGPVLSEPSALPTPTTSYSPTATATPCPSFHPDWHDYWARHRPADSRDEDEAVEWCTRWQHWQQVLLDGDAPSFSRTSVPTRTRTKQPRSDGGDQPQPPRRTPTRTPLKHGGGGGVRNAGSYKLRSGAWAGGSDAGGAFVDFGRDGGASALRNRYRDGN